MLGHCWRLSGLRTGIPAHIARCLPSMHQDYCHESPHDRTTGSIRHGAAASNVTTGRHTMHGLRRTHRGTFRTTEVYATGRRAHLVAEYCASVQCLRGFCSERRIVPDEQTGRSARCDGVRERKTSFDSSSGHCCVQCADWCNECYRDVCDDDGRGVVQ